METKTHVDNKVIDGGDINLDQASGPSRNLTIGGLSREELLSMATRFKVGEYHQRPVFVEQRAREGKVRWAIFDGSDCLSKQGHWDYEPIPSSRDGVFRKSHYFDSLEKALIFARDWIAKQGESTNPSA